MYYLVYKTTNLLNGKFYIGKHQTKNLNDGYFGSGKLLTRAVKKHGIENFVTEIIAVYETEREMNLAEKILVVCDPEISYNLCSGGHGGFSYVNRTGKNIYGNNRENFYKMIALGHAKLVELHKDPDWLARKAKRSSESSAQKGHPGTFLGRKHLEKTKVTIGSKNKITQKGELNSQHGSMWITNGFLNKKMRKNSVMPDGWRKGRI